MKRKIEIGKDEAVYFVVGPYCWGKGKTLRQATRNAQKNKPSYLCRAKYQKWIAPPSISIDDMGRISWDKGDPSPVEITRGK